MNIKIKKGFLLIELLVGLTMLLFCMLIITHYISAVKNSQQQTLKRMEKISLLRNEHEKTLIKNYLNNA